MKFLNTLIYFLILPFLTFAQTDIKWQSVQEHLQGRIVSEEGFNRLPSYLKNEVRTPLWDLGTNNAGMYLNFKTDASTIKVRYKVKGALNMAHMPTIGVSGVDLYAYDSKNKLWNWAWGNYSFKDTVSYTFNEIGSNPDFLYELYLPLYNTVEWMEIGIENSKNIEFIHSKDNPIIVYGTSIAQGACASRPGLAWTNILKRKTNKSVINLGFSGNGRLEKPILELIAKAPAQVIILDCLPNLGIIAERSEKTLDSLITNAFQYIRASQPNVPIVLTEHSSGFDSKILNHKTNKSYEQSTNIGRIAFQKLKKKGFKNIYLLSNSDISLDINSTVDYAHPTILG